jgi:hypothetical protein
LDRGSSSKLRIVIGLPPRVEQTDLGSRHLVENPLRKRSLMAQLVVPKVGHLSVGRSANDVWTRFELLDSQESIMVRWLILRRNAQPTVIGIEWFFRHWTQWFADSSYRVG